MKARNNWMLMLLFIFSTFILKAQDSLALTRLFKPQLRFDSVSSIKLNLVKHNVNNLPFFCKIEELWSISSGLNVRFRIGDIDYVNKLEGKK